MASTVIERALVGRGERYLARLQVASWDALLVQLAAQPVGIDEDASDAAEQWLVALRGAMIAASQLDQALVVAEALHEATTRRLGPKHPDALLELGAVGALASQVGAHARAEQLLQDANRQLVEVESTPSLRQAVVAQQLGAHYARRGHPTKAVSLLERAMALRKQLAPDTTLLVAAQLAEVTMQLGRPKQALPLALASYRQHCDQLGPADARTEARAYLLVSLWRTLNRPEAAVPLLTTLMDQALSRNDPVAEARACYQLGLVMDQQGRPEEALRHVERALRWARQYQANHPEPHPQFAVWVSTWARLMEARGRVDEAEGGLLEALEADRRVHGELSPQVGVRQAMLGSCYHRHHRLPEALGWFDVAVSTLRSTAGDGDSRTQQTVTWAVACLFDMAEHTRHQGPRQEARDLAQQAHDLALEVFGPGHAAVVRARRVLRSV